MNYKEAHKDSFNRTKKSMNKELQDKIFLGYYKRQVEGMKALVSIGKITSSNFLISCEVGKNEVSHDYLSCKRCVAYNYMKWKKIHFKDGFGASWCNCCIVFGGPTRINRHTRKYEFLKELRYDSYNFVENEYAVIDTPLERVEEERLVKLSDYI
jgi:hypothetical protein